jgi:Ni2+-binding GTPase involved in maturation of urease and hydrogenase
MIPLALVAGFFGAGKTWFLSTLIPELHTRGLRAQVLLNDFESAEIDATRLTRLSPLALGMVVPLYHARQRRSRFHPLTTSFGEP